MSTLTRFIAVACLGIAMSGAANAAREEPVDVVVEGLPPDVARDIKRRAAEGKTVLLAYLDRGRFIYEVRTPQVVVKEGPDIPPSTLPRADEVLD